MKGKKIRDIILMWVTGFLVVIGTPFLMVALISVCCFFFEDYRQVYLVLQRILNYSILGLLVLGIAMFFMKRKETE